MPNDSSTPTYEEHPFAPFVRILGKGKKGSRSLTEAEAIEAMTMILKGEAEDLQIGAFLMLLRVKEESPEELSGFVKAVKQICNAPTDLTVDLDWSSYAGKRRHLPWYLFAIFLLAQAGYRIFIHGAAGQSASRLYTEHVLDELGLPCAKDWDAARHQLETLRFCYMPLGCINARLAEMLNMRALLGLRSPVHSLARLINPLSANTVLQGIFHPPYAALHQQAGALLSYPHLAVIKGDGGEIECNPDNIMTVYSSRNGDLSEELWPAMFARRHLKEQELSVSQMQHIWRGTGDDEYALGAIIGTTALALKALDDNLSQETALQKARTLWIERDRKFI